MRNHSSSPRKTALDEAYFERRARDLVVPDDEIEAWELNAQDFDAFGDADDYFGAARSE